MTELPNRRISDADWREMLERLAEDADALERAEGDPTPQQLAELALRLLGLTIAAWQPRVIAASARASIVMGTPVLAGIPAAMALWESQELMAGWAAAGVGQVEVQSGLMLLEPGAPAEKPKVNPRKQPAPEPEPAQQLEAVETVTEAVPEPEPEPVPAPDPAQHWARPVEALPEQPPAAVQIRVRKPLRPASERMQRRWAGGPQSELLAARARQRRAVIAAARDPNQPPEDQPKPRKPAAPRQPKPKVELPAGWFKTSEVAQLVEQNPSNCLQSLRLRIERGVLQEGEHYRRIGSHLIWSPAAVESLEKRLPKPDRGWPDGWLGVYELGAHLGRNADHLSADLSRWRSGGLLAEGVHYQAWPGKPSRIWSVAAVEDFLAERKSSRHKQLADLEALLAEIRSEDATDPAVDSDADSEEP